MSDFFDREDRAAAAKASAAEAKKKKKRRRPDRRKRPDVGTAPPTPPKPKPAAPTARQAPTPHTDSSDRAREKKEFRQQRKKTSKQGTPSQRLTLPTYQTVLPQDRESRKKAAAWRARQNLKLGAGKKAELAGWAEPVADVLEPVGTVVDDIAKFVNDTTALAASGAKAFGADWLDLFQGEGGDWDRTFEFLATVGKGLVEFGDSVVDQLPGNLNISYLNPETGELEWFPDDTTEEDANRFFKLAKEDPLLTAAAFLPAVAGVAKAGSVARIASRIKTMNPGVNISTGRAVRLAMKESRNPYFLDALQLKGGIGDRNWNIEFEGGSGAVVVGAPWARTPLGRGFQRTLDAVGRRLNQYENLRLTGKLSQNQRGATRLRKYQRIEANRNAALMNELQRTIDKGVKEAGRHLFGKRDPALEEALVAILEAPADMPFEAAINTKILYFRNRLQNRVKGDMSPEEAARIQTLIHRLEKSLENPVLKDQKFADAVEAATEVSLRSEEIYKVWAERQGLDPEIITKRRDLITKEYAEAGLIDWAGESPAVSRVTEVAITEAEVAGYIEKLLDEIDPAVNKVFNAIRESSPTEAVGTGRSGTRRVQAPKKRSTRKRKYAPSTEQGYVKEGQGRLLNTRSYQRALEIDRDRAWELIYKHGKKEGAHPGLAAIAAKMDELAKMKALWDANKTDIDVIFGTAEGGVAQAPGWGTRTVTEVVKEAEMVPQRARAYFPHNELDYSVVNKAPSDAPPAMAGNRVRGVTKQVMNAHKNEMKRWIAAAVDTAGDTLTTVQRNRFRYEQALEANQFLWDMGAEVRAGQPVPRYAGGTVLVRYQHAPARRISAEERAALRDPQRYHERYTPEEFTPEAFEAWSRDLAVVEKQIKHPNGRTETVYQTVEGTRLLPEDVARWQKTVADGYVRAVPYTVAKALLGHARIGANEGVIAAAAGTLANANRLALIYVPGVGVRYVVRNGIQNAILMAVTEPYNFKYVAQHSLLRGKHGPEWKANIRDIDVETGAVQATAGLGDLAPILRNPDESLMVRAEVATRRASNRAGQFLGGYADEPWRRAQWFGFARRYGVDINDPVAVRRFLDDPAFARQRRQVSQMVKETMIDFDALPESIKHNVGRFLFIAPFKYGAAKWPFIWARDYPIRAGILGALSYADQAAEDQGGDLLPRGLVDVGGRYLNFSWLHPADPAAESITEVGALLTNPGDPGDILGGVASLLNPSTQWIADQFGEGYGSWADMLATILPIADIRRAQKGGDVKTQIARSLGLLNNTEMSPSIKRKRQEEVDQLNAIFKELGPSTRASADNLSKQLTLKAWIKQADQRAKIVKDEYKGRDDSKLTQLEKAKIRSLILPRAIPELAEILQSRGILLPIAVVAKMTEEEAEEYNDKLEDQYGDIAQVKSDATRARNRRK